MKYKYYKKVQKNPKTGGDYWHDFDFSEHLKLTDYQTSYQYVLKNFPPSIKVLEAGCGLGRWVVPLSKKGYTVTGIEIENEALEIISKRYQAENLSLVQGDIFNMPFENETFDIILSLGVLEHFEDIELQYDAINEHLRCLKKDGVFLVTVPHFSLMRFIFHLPFVWLLSLTRVLKGEKQYFSEYRYTVKGFNKILIKSGLKVVEILPDELLTPYNFGLTVDYPLNKLFRKGDNPFLLNQRGIKAVNFFQKLNSWIFSGGICFVCRF